MVTVTQEGRIFFPVALPALHISLGTYLKFLIYWKMKNLLEDECHILDLKLIGELTIKNENLNQDYIYLLKNDFGILNM